jgi:UDP-glucose 4-epimerase
MSDGLMLVTGGAGFIGSNLAEELLARGETVRIVDNLSTGRRENAAGLQEKFGSSLDFVEGDLCDMETARRSVDGAGVVFHVAALPSVPVSMENPVETTRHGVLATVNVLAAAKDAGARRVVFSSSSSVYGGLGPFPQRESAPPRPANPYAASKLCCEIYVRAFAEAFGLDGISLRYFNVFGPRQPLHGPYSAVFPAFITRMLRGERPVIFGDGKQTRDFTYVADTVAANICAAGADRRFRGEVVNVAAGRHTSLLDLVAMINRRLGTGLDPVHDPERPGDVRDSFADVTLARELLGHEAEHAVEDGLGPTIEHFRGIARPE